MISIVTITKNNAEGLAHTLESVKCQSFDDYELIVIDGHSKDTTQDVVSAYSSIINTFSFDEGSGIYEAMNQAIDVSTGDWLLFLNAGDFLDSERVLEKISLDLKDDLDFVFGKALCTDGLEKHPFTDWHDLWALMPFSHQAIFNHRRVFDLRKYDTSYRIAADRDFYIWAYRYPLRFHQTDVVVAICETEGVSNQNKIHRLRENYRVGRKHFPLSLRMHWYHWIHLGYLNSIIRYKKALRHSFSKNV